jgi:hypothetical protein
MFASRRGPLSAPVIKHSKFVSFFLQYSYKCACTETDMRESANDCTLPREEGHGNCGEMLHPIYDASPVSSVAECTVLLNYVSPQQFLTDSNI